MIKWSEGTPIVKIVDFGIAKLIDEDEHRPKLTKTGEVIGTPTYMSPEQIVGKDIDQRSDLYSVGCVIYELLAGVPPFVGTNSVQTILAQLNDKAVSMKDASRGREFPEELEQIVSKLLEKDPNDRYRHAGALKDDIHKIRDKINQPTWTAGADKPAVTTEMVRRARANAITDAHAATSAATGASQSQRPIVIGVIVLLTLAALVYTVTLRPSPHGVESKPADTEAVKGGHPSTHNPHVKPKS
jgi:serine/threonine-protein kinase